MATGFTLWLCLAGLYLIESLRLTAVRSLSFRPRLFGGGSCGSAPNTYPGNGRWAWTLLPLWPVRETVLVCSQPLVAWGTDCFAPNVVFVQSALAAIKYEDVKTLALDEKTLLVNGAKFIRCESEAEADRALAFVERLRALSGVKREVAIREWVAESFEEKRVTEALAKVKQATRVVRVLASVLWWVLIVLFPLLLLLLRVPDAFVILPVGAITVVLAMAISVSYAMAGGVLHPADKVKYRWKSVKFVVYPVGAMRAADELTLDCIVGAHPVVPAVLLGQGKRLLGEVKRLWQDANGHFPMMAQADAQALECSLWFNSLVSNEMKSYLKRRLPAALEEEAVCPQNASCLSYCPTCKTQYVTASGTCADCPGVALRRF